MVIYRKKCRTPIPGSAFFASLRSRSPHGYFRRAISCGNLQEKCWTRRRPLRLNTRLRTLTVRTLSVWPHCLGNCCVYIRVYRERERERDRWHMREQSITYNRPCSCWLFMFVETYQCRQISYIDLGKHPHCNGWHFLRIMADILSHLRLIVHMHFCFFCLLNCVSWAGGSK